MHVNFVVQQNESTTLSRGGRVQQATSLWMCVAPSRDKVKFDDNEWNSRPVIDV